MRNDPAFHDVLVRQAFIIKQGGIVAGVEQVRSSQDGWLTIQADDVLHDPLCVLEIVRPESSIEEHALSLLRELFSMPVVRDASELLCVG